jgi:predicted deacylase
MELNKLALGPGKEVERLEAMTADRHHVSVSVVRVGSGRPGPVLMVIAAMHGTEYASVAALGRLIQEVEPADVSGTLVLVPVANRLAFETRTMYVCPPDGKNLNRVFPGRPDGTYAEVLADLLWRKVASSADCIIDVHGGEIVEGLFPFAGAYAQDGRPEIGQTSRRAAEAFHPPYLVLNQLPAHLAGQGQRLSLVGTNAGIPSVLVEAGERGRLEEADIHFIQAGVVNVMRLLDMLAEAVEPAREAPVVVRELPVIAHSTGLFHSTVSPGDRISVGQELGQVIDYLGRSVERFTSEWDGVVLGVIGPAVVEGAMPLVIGVLADGWAPHQPL